MPTVFFLSRLKKDVKAEDYEKWVQEFDYPHARSMAAIKSYTVHRIQGAFRGERAYDYVEVVEVTNLDDYRQGLGSEEGKRLHDQWAGYIGESVAVYGEAI